MTPSAPQKSNTTRNVIFAICAVAACVWLGRFGYHAYYYEDTDDAFLNAHVHQISAQIDGAVESVAVRENETVKAGQLLVHIDPQEFEIAAQKARADEAEAKARAAQAIAASAKADADYEESKARVAQAQAQVAQLKAQFGLTKLNRDRDQKLIGGGGDDGAVTQADLDSAKSAFETAQAAVQAAEANIKAVEAAVTSAEAEKNESKAVAEAAKAQIDAGQASIRDADRKLGYTDIKAPVAGRIGQKAVEPGNRVETGQTLMQLVEPHVWIVANFKETQLARIRPGQETEISIDAIPERTFKGKVESISPASGAQFALLPPDNATGNFTKVVQRVAVRIQFDPESIGDAGDRLRPGLSAVVDVRVR